MNKIKRIKRIILMFFISATTSVLAAVPANLELETVFTTSSSGSLTARHSRDGTGRLFVVLKNGKIEVWDGGSTVLATPFLDISSKVLSGGEQGLLGLDFDPDYATNGYFYVNYTKSGSGDTVIERYKVSAGDPNIADPNSGQVLLQTEQPFGNHNGGDIHFGPDGYLYIGMGDGGSGGDPRNYAQTISNLLGSMLRINVNPDIIFKDSVEFDNRCGENAAQYYVPTDNPFAQDINSCGEIWAYGLRNPWRWSFDKLTGDLINADVGQSTNEEINFQPASSTGGENYGWRCREGSSDYDMSACSNTDVYVEPVINLPLNADGGCSVMGGYVYRGPIVAIQGLYIFSDYCNGNINFATPGAGTWSYEQSAGIPSVGFGTQSFGEDEDGNVYHLQGNTVSKIILN